MKSDISRQTFNRRNHYNRVVMQQGRVQLDADWNEQQDILLHRIETQTGDVIGRNGVSNNQNGFEVMFTPDGRDLFISPGCLYVDGLLCELEQEPGVPVQSTEQGQIALNLAEVDFNPEKVDAGPFKKEHWGELIDQYGRRQRLFKISDIKIDEDKQVLILFSDQFDFTPAQDQSINSYRVRPVTTYLTQPNYPYPRPLPDPAQENYAPVFLAYLDVWQRDVTPIDDPGILEVALGGADTAQRVQTLWQVKIEFMDNISEDLVAAVKSDTGKLRGNQRNELARRMRYLLRVDAYTPPLSNAHMPIPPSTGRLSARTTPQTGFRGLENQLYHVEIHQGNVGSAQDSIPTFKWARNNASLLVPVKIESGAITIMGSGQGSLLGLAAGQYVELIDDRSEFHGRPGHLAQIKQVNDITGQLTILPAPPDNLQNVRLRLWNGTGSIDASQNTGGASQGWIALENGIEIQFTQHQIYHSGDYWLIPARAATKKIEWPHTAPQPPQGVLHHYERLAYLLHSQTIWLAQDYRRRFYPLASDALHILDINWRNDVLQERRLLKDGLEILLDREPDQDIGAMQAAMIVTIETALPGGGAGIFHISGHFEIRGNIILWRWHRDEKEGLISRFFAKFDDLRSDLFGKDMHLERVRITLKGHHIWRTSGGRRIYLDGETFGAPGFEESGHQPSEQSRQRGPHIDLQFPSGAGRPASDFESWFYIRE